MTTVSLIDESSYIENSDDEKYFDDINNLLNWSLENLYIVTEVEQNSLSPKGVKKKVFVIFFIYIVGKRQIYE